MRVIFLHIPKTAGQSVHAALVDAFGEKAVCPARVNDQLKLMSISELHQYRVFSGHFDWTMLDCLKGPTYVFTVLRDPLERLLSFYLFLHRQGGLLSPKDRNKPQQQGMKAAFELSPREYFTGGPPHLRKFLDEHYDNFYTYFFAGRHYRARSNLVGLARSGTLQRERLLSMARDNMSHLDAVFSVDNMAQVMATIRTLGDRPIKADDDYHANVGDAGSVADRIARVKAMGGDDETFQRIEEFCELDRELWRSYGTPKRLPPPASG